MALDVLNIDTVLAADPAEFSVHVVHRPHAPGDPPWFEGTWVDLHQTPARPWEVFLLLRPHPVPDAVTATVLAADQHAAVHVVASWPMLTRAVWPAAVAPTLAASRQVATVADPPPKSWWTDLAAFALAWWIAG